ncbi:hypothetical protein pb186bvf_019051 [Paramecium bursaria]
MIMYAYIKLETTKISFQYSPRCFFQMANNYFSLQFLLDIGRFEITMIQNITRQCDIGEYELMGYDSNQNISRRYYFGRCYNINKNKRCLGTFRINRHKLFKNSMIKILSSIIILKEQFRQPGDEDQ